MDRNIDRKDRNIDRKVVSINFNKDLHQQAVKKAKEDFTSLSSLVNRALTIYLSNPNIEKDLAKLQAKLEVYESLHRKSNPSQLELQPKESKESKETPEEKKQRKDKEKEDKKYKKEQEEREKTFRYFRNSGFEFPMSIFPSNPNYHIAWSTQEEAIEHEGEWKDIEIEEP